jgi:hypothetical protein
MSSDAGTYPQSIYADITSSGVLFCPFGHLRHQREVWLHPGCDPVLIPAGSFPRINR